MLATPWIVHPAFSTSYEKGILSAPPLQSYAMQGGLFLATKSLGNTCRSAQGSPELDRRLHFRCKPWSGHHRQL